MLRKVFSALFLMIIIVGLVTGCAQQQPVKRQQQILYSATDARGKQLSFAAKPQKIVSCFVFADEVLLDLVPHSHIAGMDKWIHDAELSSAATEAADVKTVVEVNTESIAKLQPDLVLLPDSTRPELVAALEDLKIKVYLYKNAHLLSDIETMIQSLAQAVDEPEKGEKLIRDYKNDLAALKKMQLPGRPEEKAILFLRFGAIGGRGTIYHDVLTTMGFRDAYEEGRQTGGTLARNTSSILSKEEVVKCNPDIFIMGLWTQGGSYKDSEQQLQDIYNDQAYASVNAVINRKAYIVPQRYVNCLSHHAGKNMLELAQILNARLKGHTK